jgi:Flp pilus assembly protein TadB
MPHALSILAGWGCVGLGLLFVLQGARRLQEERRQHRNPVPGLPLSGRELLWEGAAVGLLGAGNLLGGGWVLLAIPAMVIMPLLLVRLLVRWGRTRRQSR